MGDSPTEWEWPASAISWPNGLASARCLDKPRCNPPVEPHLPLPVPGNGILRPETKRPKRRSRRAPLSVETTSPATMPANGGPFVPRQEISVFAGLRGGLGRTRTSNQTVMVRARTIFVPQGLSSRDAEVRVDEPKNRIIAIILADGV